MTILLTGAAGFIGAFTMKRLLEAGHRVIGVDELNDYYSVQLKLDRLALCGFDSALVGSGKLVPSGTYQQGLFQKLDLANRAELEAIFKREKIHRVCHLAAQAGVRYSLEHPEKYVHSNILGFFEVMDLAQKAGVDHFLFASSSSVYGMNEKFPFAVEDPVDHPRSFYAATKKSNELLAHSYSHLHRLPVTGLRFFTVYGPYGRPDMAACLFAERIAKGEPITVYNEGKLFRDFTYIDDIAEGVISALLSDPKPIAEGASMTPGVSTAPYRLYNIGASHPENLMDFIGYLEEYLGKKAHINFAPLPPGDVLRTGAEMTAFERDFGYRPKVSLREGLRKFVEWYVAYYRLA